MVEKLAFTRSYLETLSSADLIDLVADYGVDIPDGLNRRFIISELLDVIDNETDNMIEQFSVMHSVQKSEKNEKPVSEKKTSRAKQQIHANEEDNLEEKAPYYETKIVATLRNPSWLFVFWTINQHDIEKDFSKRHTLSLAVCYYTTKQSQKPDEVFKIPTDFTEKDLNIFISLPCYAIKVCLLLKNKEQVVQTLAKSNKIIMAEIPHEIKPLRLACDAPPISLISGLNHIWHSHYFIHKQAN
ncbi:MAG: DUF4912 domain-containing protein [Treponemataceae bacterium]